MFQSQTRNQEDTRLVSGVVILAKAPGHYEQTLLNLTSHAILSSLLEVGSERMGNMPQHSLRREQSGYLTYCTLATK